MSLPRVGFVGLGWIGRLRLDAVAEAGAAEVAALCDSDTDRLAETHSRFPDAQCYADLDELLASMDRNRLDGLVLATPNALHAPQARAALQHELPLFMQKPLGLRPAEVADVIARAKATDRLVAVDYSYRGLKAAAQLRERARAGSFGQVHLVEATFHNAYGPERSWSLDRDVSGGGALLDLGVHLLDLVFWIFGISAPTRIGAQVRDVEDHPGIDRFTAVHMMLNPERLLRLTCSWHAHVGRDCDFRLVVHGSEGGAELRNVGGSFYDFELVVRSGRREKTVVRESRDWMNSAILAWLRGLADPGYDPSLETSLTVARVVEAIYGDAAFPVQARLQFAFDPSEPGKVAAPTPGDDHSSSDAPASPSAARS